MVTIEVRSPFQRMILDTLAEFETYEQCLRFRDSLPNTQQKDICTAMIMMLAYAYIDQDIQTEEDCAIARDIIASISAG